MFLAFRDWEGHGPGALSLSWAPMESKWRQEVAGLNLQGCSPSAVLRLWSGTLHHILARTGVVSAIALRRKPTSKTNLQRLEGSYISVCRRNCGCRSTRPALEACPSQLLLTCSRITFEGLERDTSHDVLTWGLLELYIVGGELASCILLGCIQVPPNRILRYLWVLSIAVM